MSESEGSSESEGWSESDHQLEVRCFCYPEDTRSDLIGVNVLFDWIVHYIFSDDMVKEKLVWYGDALRPDFLKHLRRCLSGCPVHERFINARLNVAVSMIGNFSSSVREIDEGFKTMVASIGDEPFPNPLPPTDQCGRFQECRRRLIRGDNELLTTIVTVLTTLLSKFYQKMRHIREKMNSIILVKRTETVRLLACLWMLPEPIVFNADAPSLRGEIKNHIRSMCREDEGLYRIFVSSISTPANFVGLLSTKLEEYKQEFDNVRNIWTRDYWNACLNGEVLREDDII